MAPDADAGKSVNRADPFAPLTSEHLAAGDGHEIYVESIGREGGIAAVYLHGGPGSGCQPDHRRLFDPERFHAVLFDQRGAGRSRPKGRRDANTLPHLIESKGDFISLASVAGLRGFPGETVYNASKFGQLGFTRSLDHEMREKGVRVTNLCPGGIATEFAMGTGRTPDMPELEGMMSAEEVADVAWFVVSRPKGLRMMTVSFRPMNEGSWG